MARSYTAEERWEVPDGIEPWTQLRALDTYLATRVKPNGLFSRVTITDERGTTSGPTLHEAYADWQTDPHRLQTVYCVYDNSNDDLMATVMFIAATQPGLTRDASTFSLNVRGTDPAEVRGVSAEARERANRAAPQPEPVPAPAPALSPTSTPHAHHASPTAQPGPASSATAEKKSRLGAVINNPWIVGTGVTVIGGLILVTILAHLT